jgi:hypothetical protein
VDDAEEVVVDCGTWFVAFAAPSVVGGLQPGDERQAPHPVLTRCRALVGELIAKEPIPQGRVVGMDLPQHVDQMRIVPVPPGHGIPQPLVIPLG